MTFLKGESTGGWAIVAETVIGCVPVLGQLVDARDIIKAIIILSANPASPAGWFDLITALIGLVPGGGDAVKMSLKSVKKGALPMDSILDGIRKLGKGDPEQLIRKCLDFNALQKNLDKILTNPQVLNQLSPQARKNVDQIRRNLGKQLQEFKKEVDGWLIKSRKTSADANASSKTQTTKPKSPSNGSGNTNNTNRGKTNTSNNSSIAQKTINQLSDKLKGILGEHMADYYCQDIKGWGKKASHDKSNAINQNKLNDSGEMVQLISLKSRGRGIDGVWKTNGSPKKYAIIEAKCSQSPTRSLKDLLGEKKKKNGADKQQAATFEGTGRRNRGGGSSPSLNSRGGVKDIGGERSRNTDGYVTQMSHNWIRSRLLKAVSQKQSVFSQIMLHGYFRLVVFFSIPQVVSHAYALIEYGAKKVPNDALHTTHQPTRIWGDSDISKVVDNKGGLTGSNRSNLGNRR